MDLTSARETTRMDLTSAPEYFNFAEDVLGICAQHYPERTAILALDERGHETPGASARSTSSPRGWHTSSRPAASRVATSPC